MTPAEYAGPCHGGCGKELRPSRSRKGYRCQKCAATALNSSPEHRAKVQAGMKRRLADPEARRAHAERTNAGRRRSRANNPEKLARARETGRQLGTRTGELHPAGSPMRRRVAQTQSATALKWCPPEYRDEYRRLRRPGGIPAPEARRIILEQVEADAKRQPPRRKRTFAEQLAAVAAGAKLVEVHPMRKAAPAVTLGGVATGMI